MFPEFDTEDQKLSQEIQRLWSGEQDTSSYGISVAIAKESQTLLLKLEDPVILTPQHRIAIPGQVFAVSALEAKKSIQGRYNTPGVNRFPVIVEEMLRRGQSREFIRLGQSDLQREARLEINNLQRIYPSAKPEESVVFLSDLDPLTPVTEYVIDGKHTSGVALRAQRAPLIVEAEKTRLQFTSASGVKITEGRVEKRAVFDLIGPRLKISGIQNNISITQRQSKETIGNALAFLSIFLAAIGFIFSIIRRGRLLEIGLPLLFIGALILVMIFFTDWGREYFQPGEIEIVGEAPMEISFYGELQ